MDGATATDAGDGFELAANPPVIPGYAVGEVLGAGAFSTVWAGRGEQAAATDWPVAIKVARAPGAAAAARLRRESAILVGIGPPAVARVLETGTAAGRAFIAMERIAGAALAEILARRQQPFAVAEAAAMVGGIAESVAAIHEAGVVHRDLKPENVFAAAGQDSARVIDFGLAVAVGDAAAAGGTPEYAAPETLAPGLATTATDSYALGALLFELLTLWPPFVGDATHQAYAHAHLRPPPPSSRGAESGAGDDLVMACLAKDPAARPSAREVAAACAAIAAASSETAVGRRVAIPAAPVLAPAANDEDLACLVVARGPGTRLARLLADAGAVLVAGDGARVTCAVTALEADRPAAAAVALARLAVGAGAGAVFLHAARVTVRRRRGRRPRIAGAAALSPETWLPADSASSGYRVVATADFARALPGAEVVALEDGFFGVQIGARATGPAAVTANGDAATVPPVEDGAAMTFGRDKEMAAVSEAIAGAIAGDSGPVLITVAGASGMGKTRLAHDVAQLVGRAFPAARLVHGDPGDARGAPVVAIVDDAHRVAAAVVDRVVAHALEPGAPFAAVLLAEPRYFAQRPHLGQRSQRHVALTLEPLAGASARALVAALLAEVAFPPAAALDRIARWAGGNPGSIHDLVAALRADGVITSGEGRARIDTARLGALPAGAADEWLGARALMTLPAEMAAFAQELAVLGGGVTEAEAEAVHDRLGSSAVDARAGLAYLEGAGLLVRGGGGDLRFASERVLAGVRQAAGKDLARAANAAALALWRGEKRSPRVLARMAHAARVAGAWNDAAAASLALARAAEGDHRPVDADREASACLDAAALGERDRAEALRIRGRARVALDRAPAAIADFQAAAAVGRALGDDPLVAGALLDEATALDWAGDLAASEARAHAAAALLADDNAALVMALGRSAWRRGDHETAARLLARACTLARAAKDTASETVALLLLPLAHTLLGQLSEAAARFEEGIALCAARGDKVHLSAAYGNRTILWSAQNRPERAREDLRRALELAREVGHPGPERAPTYNLAEDLYWAGDLAEAEALARRSRFLQSRFLPVAVAEDALLLARILVAAGDSAGARAELAWIEAEVSGERRGPSVRHLMTMVELRLAAVDGAFDARLWARLGEAATGLVTDERIEIAWAWAEAACIAGTPADRNAAAAAFRKAATGRGVWQRRLAALRTPCGGRG